MSAKLAAFLKQQLSGHRKLPGVTSATALGQQAIIPFINDIIVGFVSTTVTTDEMSPLASSPVLCPGLTLTSLWSSALSCRRLFRVLIDFTITERGL